MLTNLTPALYYKTTLSALKFLTWALSGFTIGLFSNKIHNPETLENISSPQYVEII